MDNKRVCLQPDPFKLIKKQKRIDAVYLKSVLSLLQARTFDRSLGVLDGQYIEIDPLENIFNEVFSDTDRLIKILIEINSSKKYSTNEEACYNYWKSSLEKVIRD